MTKLRALCISLLMVLNISAYAKPIKSARPAEERTYQYMYETDSIKLTKLVEIAQKNIDRPILIHSYARSTVVAKGALPKIMNLDAFGEILAENFMTVVEKGEFLVVLPSNEARTSSIPVVEFRDDLPYKNWQWVTTSFQQKNNIKVAKLMPVIRPLLPGRAHLGAHIPTNKILITASYGNVKRIINVLNEIDADAP